MDKMKLAQWGEKLKTGGAQMGRMVSGKMKEILQGPTPESKMVDEATLETLEEPNWGLNMRICSMINSEQLNGTEIVRAVKKKISGKDAASQRLSLDLLEACTVNCEKVASEVASEKLLEEMVKMIENPQTHHGNRQRALQLIRAWGQSDDLVYLPVFRQTYTSLNERSTQLPVDNDDGNASPLYQTMESYIGEPVPPPENYPVNNTGNQGNDFGYNYGSLSVEQKKELFEVTRNSIEVLSSISSTGTEANTAKDELTENMLEKCKQSQLAIQMIIESTTDDDGILFEALNLNDELQQVISKFEGLETGPKSDTTAGNLNAPLETDKETMVDATTPSTTAATPTDPVEIDKEHTVGATPSSRDEIKTTPSPADHDETKTNASQKGTDSTESSNDGKISNEN